MYKLIALCISLHVRPKVTSAKFLPYRLDRRSLANELPRSETGVMVHQAPSEVMLCAQEPPAIRLEAGP